MGLLELLVVLIVIAILLPLFGVSLDPNVMKIAGVILVIVLLVWLFTGTGLHLQ